MRPTIVVGVGGAGGWHALAWAADEALAAGGRLLLCHACPPESPLAGSGPSTPMGLLELADPALARAVASTRARLGGDRVALAVRPGRAAAVLAHAAADADLLVVGRSGRPGRRGTAHHLAAHAPCPVVVARPVAGHGRLAGHVVIGVDHTDSGRAALEFGFAHADLRRRPVAAVRLAAHADQDYWYDASRLPRAHSAEPADLDLLATEVEPWLRKYPEVPVQRAIIPGTPDAGLAGAAGGAALLVVGDHGRGPVVRTLLGTVSDGALQAAHGPVAVVPVERRTGGPT